MNEKWLIKICPPDQARELFAIQQASFSQLRGFRMRAWKLHEFAEMLRQNRACGLWESTDKAPLLRAYIMLHELPQAWEILHLASHPDYWGRGLMQRLLRHCQQTYAESSKPLWLEVHEQNARAIRLYEQLGFINVGRRNHFYEDGGAALLYTYAHTHTQL